MSSYFKNESLLASPTKRAAYSDRTSYLMAEMSRLAYFRFEGGSNINDIVSQAKELFPEHEKLSSLEALIRSKVPDSSEAESRAILADILKQSDFKLIETFNDPGTDAQAFLCVQEAQKIAILAFRGTELNLKDIKADVSARLTDDAKYLGKSAKMHTGYWNQFESLSVKITEELAKDEVKNLQLYITGHSLGGALAITAVKFLASDITGACYTFGSPPVGTKEFDKDIKTPIYRIVNHVDIVPRLPNPIMVHGVRLLALVIGIILSPFAELITQIKESSWYDKLSRLLIDAQKYRQSGYGSYLVGEGKSARLRYSVGVYDKLLWWGMQILNIFKSEFKLVSDHSIETYSKKLAVWAETRK